MAKYVDVADRRQDDVCQCSHNRAWHSADGCNSFFKPCGCKEFAFSRRAPDLEEKLYAAEKAARELKLPAGRSLKLEGWVIKRSRFTDADGVVREFTPDGVVREFTPEFAAREAERASRIVMKPVAPPCRHPLLRVKADTPYDAAPCAICGALVNTAAWLQVQPRGAFLAAADYATNQVVMQTLLILCRCTHRRDFHVNDEWECRYSGCECGMFVEAEKRAPQKEKPAPPILFSDLTRKFWKDED